MKKLLINRSTMEYACINHWVKHVRGEDNGDFRACGVSGTCISGRPALRRGADEPVAGVVECEEIGPEGRQAIARKIAAYLRR